MKARSPTSASLACFCKDRSAFLTTHWWRWFLRCQKRFLARKTAPCFARDVLREPKTCKKRPRTRDSRPASSITNSCTRARGSQESFEQDKFFAAAILQTLMTERFPALFFPQELARPCI